MHRIVRFMGRIGIGLALLSGLVAACKPITRPEAAPAEVALPENYRTWFHLGSKTIRPEGAKAVGLPEHIFGNTVDSVYANEVALADLRAGTRPFRDGARFVAVFNQLATPVAGLDAAGALAFTAVMEKDAAAYAATNGWGFEAFAPDGKRLTDLRPACVACHTQQAENDFVFSQLVERRLETALTADNGTFLPPDYRQTFHIGSKAITPEGAKAIGLPAEIFGDTFDAVYANNLAVEALRTGTRPFPAESLLIAEFHKLAKPVDGLGAFGDLAFTAVMYKNVPGKGDAEVTGDWNFEAFDAAGKPLTDLRPACHGCHSAQSANDYVFTNALP